MKKIAMMLVRALVNMLPVSSRKKLRSNPFLYVLYTTSLHKSGLFYGFPSQKKLFALYKDCLKKQQEDLAVLPPDTRKYAVVVLGSNKDLLQLTLCSLAKLQERLHAIYVNKDVLPAVQSIAAKAKPLSDLAEQPHEWLPVSYTTSPSPRDRTRSRMPSSA